MSLLQVTQRLLRRHQKAGTTLQEVADTSGGTISFDWLKSFSCERIPNPGVNSVQTLHDHLKTLKFKRKSAA